MLFFLPGGCAITCTPASRISSPVIIRRAVPPPNSVGNMRPKWSLTWSKVVASSSRVSRSILLDRVLERRHRLGQVGVLRVEEALALARRGRAPRAPRG